MEHKLSMIGKILEHCSKGNLEAYNIDTNLLENSMPEFKNSFGQAGSLPLRSLPCTYESGINEE